MTTLPNKFENGVTYIICPDIKCKGFEEELLRCTGQGYSINKCPQIDEAYKVVYCSNGHENKMPINKSSWCRVDCGCGIISFTLMSGKYQRIAKEDYEKRQMI